MSAAVVVKNETFIRLSFPCETSKINGTRNIETG